MTFFKLETFFIFGLIALCTLVVLNNAADITPNVPETKGNTTAPNAKGSIFGNSSFDANKACPKLQEYAIDCVTETGVNPEKPNEICCKEDTVKDCLSKKFSSDANCKMPNLKPLHIQPTAFCANTTCGPHAGAFSASPFAPLLVVLGLLAMTAISTLFN